MENNFTHYCWKYRESFLDFAELFEITFFFSLSSSLTFYNLYLGIEGKIEVDIKKCLNVLNVIRVDCKEVFFLPFLLLSP